MTYFVRIVIIMLNFFSYIGYHIKRNLFKASKTCLGISFFSLLLPKHFGLWSAYSLELLPHWSRELQYLAA